MSDAEDATTVRKTRSGRAVRTPSKPKTAPKATARRTRKKVVVMEVEVTDDEETEQPQEELTERQNEEQEESHADFDDPELSQEELLEEPLNKRARLDEDQALYTNEVELESELVEEVLETSNHIVEEETKTVNMDDFTDPIEETGNFLNGSNDVDMVTDQDMEIIAQAKSDAAEEETEKEADAAEKEADSAETEALLNDLSGVTEQHQPGISQNGEPEAENISDDELPGVPVAKVPETEEVSDEELPEPKRAELPADTEVVSEDELPTTKKDNDEEESSPLIDKENKKRKLSEGGYDPTSPTSETEGPVKKSKDEKEEKDKEAIDSAKPPKPKKLPELDKYWKAVNDDPTDFTGWTYLLQYVDQENDMEAAREAYDAFLSHYPYCYGYWRKYADYEKRKGNKKKCEEVFERGLKAIPLSVDLWIHYLTYVKATRGEDEDYVRSQFERAITACGLEFRSDRLWESYIKWETDGKRLQKVTAIFDRLLATPTQSYTTHFDNFQEHVASNPPNKILEVDEFLAFRKEVRGMLKSDDKTAESADLPPGDEDSKLYTTDEETKCIRERIVSIRRKAHKGTVNAVTARWNFEEGIKRPYFHVKPLERCQLKNWQEYLDYEIEQGDRVRIIVLFERCLIACALYEEFWLKFVTYLEGLKDPEFYSKIRDVYERACTIHHLKKPNLHLQWAVFEEACNNVNRAAEILVNLEKQVPNVLQIAYRRINLERRRLDYERCTQLFEHYIGNSKNKLISSNIAIKYSRFCLKILKNFDKATEALRTAISKDPNNPRLYLQLVDLTLQKEDCSEEEICVIIDEFLEKDAADPDQKALFAQRKLEYLEDFGSSIGSVQAAYEQFQKYQKLSKESGKKKESKNDSNASSAGKKEKAAQSSTPSQSYSGYNYGTGSNQTPYNYTGSQQGQYNYAQYGQGDQYQYQNWQYPQSGYGSYNQWSGYTGGYTY